MPSGGARAGAGRPQDPNALDTSRRKDTSGLVVLSSTPRTTPAPEWSLSAQSDSEVEQWARLWRKPQAQYWIDFDMLEVVALFVRQFCEAATPMNSAENRKAAQSFFSVLGLTAPALKAAGYTIAATVPDEKPKQNRASRSTASSGLKVLDGGKGA